MKKQSIEQNQVSNQPPGPSTYMILYNTTEVKQYQENFANQQDLLRKNLEILLVKNNLTLCPLYGKRPAFELLRSVDNPLKDIDKNPPGPGEILSWFERSNNNKSLNLGIRTGETSGPADLEGGLVVLDFDISLPGKILKELELPDTAKVKSGGGGYHYYYHCKNPSELVSRSSENNPLDIKASGDYVVAPPSIHPDTGKPYRWERSNKENPLAPGNVAELKPFHVENINKFTEKYKKNRNTSSQAKVRKKETTPPRKKPPVKAGENWKEQAGDPEVAESLMETIIELSERKNQSVKVGKCFKSPLPDHSRKDHAGVALYKPDQDQAEGTPYYRLKIFHDSTARETMSLAEVYASVVSGKMQDFRKGSQKNNGSRTGTVRIWWLRLLNEAGLKETPTRHAPELPEDTKDSIKKVYESFRYLLELRTLHDSAQEGTPFSWRFAEAWTGLGRGTVQRAVKWLMERDYIVLKEKRGGKFEANILELGTLDQVKKAKERIKAQENKTEDSKEEQKNHLKEGVKDETSNRDTRGPGEAGGQVKRDGDRPDRPGSLEPGSSRGDPAG